jgi:outer membrane protein assembly factor BamB
VTFAPTTLIVTAGNSETRTYARSDGRVLWSVPVRSALPATSVPGGFAIISSGELLVLDEGSGDVRWRVTIGEAHQPPVGSPERVVAISGSAVRAFRPQDGAPLWQTELGHVPVTAIVLGGTYAFLGLDDRSVIALEPSSGAIAWKTTLDVGAQFIATGDGRLFVVTTGRHLCALDTSRGRMDWGSCFAVRVPASGPPLVHEGAVYLALFDNTVRVFDARSGSMRRREAVAARPATGPVRFGSHLVVPLVTDDLAVLSPQATTPGGPSTSNPGPAQRSLETVAVAADAQMLATITVTPGLTRVLTTYRFTEAAQAPAPSGSNSAPAK